MTQSRALEASPKVAPARPEPRSANPFPGLRPFAVGEASLFFGRAQHVETLLLKLRKERLLAVVGSSGSGKSSLVFAGILPRLERGYRTATGAHWRVVTLRPGSDPIAHLAAALQAASEQSDEQDYDELESVADGRSSGTHLGRGSALERDLRRTELERSSNGLVEAVRSLGLGPEENLLLVVDQFEELFRFHRLIREQPHDASAAFVKLLLRASQQTELPIHVMLTLRSDFLGECVEFPGLAEAISDGQYLVPLLNRDQRAEVIRGPVGVAGATISTALVQRLLNDAGDMTDQLPVLQHAMMRTFALAQSAAKSGAPVRLELAHYEAAFEMTGALSHHADEAYAEIGHQLGARGQRLTERLFRCLTDGGEHGGGVRRPCQVAEVLAMSGSDLPTLTEVVAAFAGQGRGFLVQQPGGALTAETTLDISHESLMRKWDSLRRWLVEEAALGSQLRALADAQRAYAAGKRSLLRDPELSLSLKWRREQAPTVAVGQRYGVDLAAVNAFLDKSAGVARRRVIILWGAIGAVFLGLSLLAFQLHQSRRQAERSANDARAARVKAESAEAEAQRALAAARMATLVRLAKDTEDEPGRSAAYLRETSDPARARGATWQSLAAGSGQRRFSWKLGGHRAEVQSAAFSSDGLRIVTAAHDGTARVWESDTGRLLVKLEDGVQAVRSAFFSVGDQRIATVSDGAVVRIWDAATGQVTARLVGHTKDVTRASFSADGTQLVTSSWDKTARVWEVASGNLLATLRGHTGELYDASFAHDGKRVVTASSDRSARIWDVRSGLAVTVLNGHRGVVSTARFSPDDSHVVTAADDQSARLWDATSGQMLMVLSGHAGPLAAAEFSHDGQRIVSASADKTAKVWDRQTGALRATLEGHTDRVHAATFSADDTRVITASWDSTARVWSASTGQSLAVLAGHEGVVHAAAFSADGQRIVTCSDAKSAWVWDGRTTEREGHSAPIGMISASPDGSRLVTASNDHTARLWDSGSGKPLATLIGHSAPVRIALFSPDGSQVLTASSDHTVRTWSASTGKSSLVFDGHRGAVTATSYSADGRRVVSGSLDQSALVWDSSTGHLLTQLLGHRDGVSDASFNPDGTRIVTASWDGSAKIWDSQSGRCLFTLPCPAGPVHSATFSHSGERVVTASEDGSALLWDARTGALLRTLTGHAAALRGASFSADGAEVLTVSEDGTARLWDASTGALRQTFAGHGGAVNSASFSHDGRLLVTASADKTARVWERTSGALVGRLEGHLGSVLGASFSADDQQILTISADETAGFWRSDGDTLRFIAGRDATRRAVVRHHDGHALAEVWSDTARRWLDARTVFWQELGLCLSKEERMEGLSETAAQASSGAQRCRDAVAACRQASPEDCERSLALTGSRH